MSNIEVRFCVRIRDRAPTSAIAERVERLLGIRFAPSTDDTLPEDAMESFFLGMQVVLSYWPVVEEGELRTYQLAGEGIQYRRPESSPLIVLSEWVLHLLQRGDCPDWYIPAHKDFLADVGIQK